MTRSLDKYEVNFSRGPLGWTWYVTGPNGELFTSCGTALSRRSAERDALQVIRHHAESPPAMTGAQLAAIR